jgi:hypothetical protein
MGLMRDHLERGDDGRRVSRDAIGRANDTTRCKSNLGSSSKGKRSGRGTHAFAHPADDSDLVFPSELESLGVLCDLSQDREPLPRLRVWVQQDGRERFDRPRQVDERR